MATEKAPLSDTDIVTSDARLSFPSLFVPKAFAEGSPAKFQAVFLLPPGTNLKPFEAAVKAAMLKKFGKVIPVSGRFNPIRAADGPHYAELGEGWTAIPASGTRQPAIVDQRRVPVTDESRVYPGMWVRAYLNAYGWDQKGRGVSFGLNAIQIVRDGDRLDGRKSADQVFEALEMPEDGSDLMG